ncbi:tRNA (guanosine(18)-2'-O)-methyltransferase TrmH [Psychrosphaera sp. B3R10]|uniref:tRNA (guanosine(18)-2'-O)-methyltransferase n=1 Tax=Psychrosphaera algicola TaxID=3023714 RepID=A0ABT5FFU5_9GAMM|nr:MULTISPECIES: tRNA (guanosine(18)-2'-O)-methyltransferase TrmH [unclassified Psychrosphaera]MBU2883062.1 tRNA (guanosine(18)-2'-O)-methyltransferase TrmH [Psychrosphaera sp. I2R16]MBU2988519.1 tRNA (guanosine(18)-2'-O)-methyltransferase TrmH [Psychrosphaera sp. B3R10]MDC2890430.1 tRNA (guanosine(18)-2'-O)-methyltransferase TrmH [Psychrosphaera sp. G1-22]MDO6719579.1 tRNA (guanosine(18)-2'-O)-methyltransferase TrmH [Psychrosphaera sp. 1_MG-2023]
MTPERFKRITDLLDKRQTDLTVCMEQVHKTHNLSAIIRTADAVGIHNIHAIYTTESRWLSGGRASGSQKWVKVTEQPDTTTAINQFKQQGMQVLATNLSDKAVDFRDIDYTKPTALILGQERDGISEQALEMADHHIVVPMYGMVESLNVSVAGALIMYEAQRQRREAGMYNQSRIDKSIRHQMLFEGGHPIYAELCVRTQTPYPPLDEYGQIAADPDWYQTLKQRFALLSPEQKSKRVDFTHSDQQFELDPLPMPDKRN